MSKKSRQHRAKSAPAATQSAVKTQVQVLTPDAQFIEQSQDPASQELTDGEVLDQSRNSIDEQASEEFQPEPGAARTDVQSQDESHGDQAHDQPAQSELAQEGQAQDDRAHTGQAEGEQAHDDQAQVEQVQHAQSREPEPESAKKPNNKPANKHGKEPAQRHALEQPGYDQPSTYGSNQGEPHADIRGVLIQLAGARLLLPNANIAEVLSYAPPEPVATAPEWLLGKMRWRGWQLPLVAFAELAGLGKEPAGLGSKVVVLKALSGNPKAPYFAILTQGFPRLVTVSKESLPDADSTELPPGVLACVIMNEDTAFVPDLVAVEGMINDAIAQAA